MGNCLSHRTPEIFAILTDLLYFYVSRPLLFLHCYVLLILYKEIGLFGLLLHLLWIVILISVHSSTKFTFDIFSFSST